MAATALTVTPVAVAGSTLTLASANVDGNWVVKPGPGVYLIAKNGDASPTTVTVAVPGNAWNGQANPDTAVTVAAGAEKAIPLRAEYADSNNRANITYSSVTSLTVGAYRF